MQNWASQNSNVGLDLPNLDNEVGKAGTNDSVALISIGVAVYRAIRAIR